MTIYNQMKAAAAVGAFSLVAACSSAPKGEQLPVTTDVNQALQETQAQLDQARANNLEILSPENFENAQESMEDARKALVKGNSKEKILREISETRAWLAQAQTRGDIVNAAAKGLPAARTAANNAQASKYFPKEYKKLEAETFDVAEEAEEGDLAKLTKEADTLTAKYRELEVRAVTKAKLGNAEANIARAEKEGAEKKAPQTWKAAQAEYETANSLILSNPSNTAAIDAAAARATEQSQFLLEVTQRVKEGNTEALILQTENQNRKLQGLAARNQAAQNQLAQKDAALQAKGTELEQQNAILQTAEKLRTQLRPNEAEVFVQGDKVMVRLKGVQFASSKATLNQKSSDLLQKVDKAINSIGGVNAITIQGHTDSVGSEEVNKEISQKRAEAVQEYLTSKGQQPAEKVSSVGMGPENPIADNKTSYGRAQNRRIDLVIEPTLATGSGTATGGTTVQ